MSWLLYKNMYKLSVYEWYIVAGVTCASTATSKKSEYDPSTITKNSGNKRASSGSVGDFIAQNRKGKK